MFVKNQVFRDEDTLLEMLFDFSLGEETEEIRGLKSGIEKDLQENQTYQQYLETITDEEDRLELETEERRIRLAEALMEKYDSFKTFKQKLYGIKNQEESLLYSIDMV